MNGLPAGREWGRKGLQTCLCDDLDKDLILFETVHVDKKPLRRTHNRLNLVLPFISLRCPSFHHVHLPRVGTPQCSLCQQLPAHVFVS